MKVIYSFLLALAISTAAFAQRNLEMKGSPNFRELGGLVNQQGATLKEGLLFRSGSFANLQAEDLKIFRETGITTVIDFRSDAEIAREPDSFPEGMPVNYINAPIGSMDQKGMSQFLQVLSKPDFKEQDVEMLMIQANLGFVKSLADFKPLFDQIQVPDTKVLFHCTAGKDRTGLAASLILYSLGFDRKVIFEDFMRSNEAVSKTDLSKMSAYGIPEDRAKLLMGVELSYLEAAWSAIESNYGSMDEMLVQVFGIDETVKEKLRAKYLDQ